MNSTSRPPKVRYFYKILLLLGLLLSAFGASAQTSPPQIKSPIAPTRLDPVRLLKYDLNRDGKLDLLEQDVARAGSAADRTQRAQRFEERLKQEAARAKAIDLQRFDTNQDGTLDEDEQIARDRWHADQTMEFLKKYDKNGDGRVSLEELKGAN